MTTGAEPAAPVRSARATKGALHVAILGWSQDLIRSTPLLLAIVGATQTVALPLASAQVRAATVVRAAEPEEIELSDEEVAELKEMFDQLPEAAQAEMRAVYLDMGIDIDELFARLEGGAPAEAAPGAPGSPPAQSLLQSVSQMNFARTPESVLAARARLGLERTELPAADAEAADLAEWLHLHVLAGEWESFETFMRERAGDDADGIYSHVLQSTNQGEPAILPEEVLAMGDAAPELTEWQLDVLSQLLKTAAKSSSTGPLLEQIAGGTKMFGPSPENRSRTAAFLARAGMIIEAYDYLTPLEEARAEQNAQVMLDHAAYHAARARSLSGPEGDRALTTSWRIFCDTALLSDAPFEKRQEGMRSAISMLSEIPPAVGTEWLTRVFENEALAPVALQVIALEGLSARDAQAMLTMKEAVDTLLTNPEIDVQVLRVPLRMLTIGLINQAESTIKDYDKALGSGRGVNGGTRRKVELLLRALPDEQWFSVIDASLATRAYRASVEIALLADEPDVALDLLEQAITRFPGESEVLAGAFLDRWSRQLSPAASPAMNQGFFFGPSMRAPSAPLTRGRQRRNLDRLVRLVDTLDEIGIDARRFDSIVVAFKACHGRSEAFTRERLVEILGPVEELGPSVAASIAGNMRSSLNGDWRNRQVHQQAGMRRSADEITAIVSEGYDLAIELIDSAIRQEPDSWRHAMMKAALAHDRLQYASQQQQEFAAFNEHRRQAFEAFADAAAQYGRALEEGRERASSGVYPVWFNAALGSSELNYLTRDDVLLEGSDRDDQIDLIRRSIMSLPRDAADEHIAEFARGIVGSLGRLDPEVKPRVIKHARRVIGDHPAGAPLRRLDELYQDLVKDEVKLRLTLDGSANVGDEPFGAVLTLRYTNAVDRETGGFARYLQNNVWAMRGNRGTIVNYRDRLQESLETSLGDSFVVESIGFFESMNPPRSIQEDGERGWLEKPVAYLVLRAVDPSVDHVPPLQMDLSFTDTAGPVTLPVVSNTPLIDASGDADPRPMFDAEVMQTVDVRSMHDAEQDRAITLEISVKARGLVPDLDTLLAGVHDALPGYRVRVDDGIDARPINAIMADQSVQDIWGFGQQVDEDIEYAVADSDGIFRITTERSWLVTYEPSNDALGSEFALPSVNGDVEATITSMQYADADIVPVTASTVPVVPRGFSMLSAMMLAVGALLVGALVIALAYVVRRGRLAPNEGTLAIPDDLTPTGAITMLQRLEPRLGGAEAESIQRDIEELELRYFGPNASEEASDLVPIVQRWAKAANA